jgi:hypothetical protein
MCEDDEIEIADEQIKAVAEAALKELLVDDLTAKQFKAFFVEHPEMFTINVKMAGEE